jgi:DNA polymerase-3 subunit delta'
VIYGNQELFAALAASAAGGRLCHAYLFWGPQGVGKKTFAHRFAQMILCRGEQPRPCGECPSCRKFASGNHPDFSAYDGRQGANAIHIDWIRALRADVYVRPNDGDHKICLIPRAEDLSPGAANALLKVLEEPPPYAVFLLTADNRDRVPLTIRSRCIVQELYPLGMEAAAAALGELLPDRGPEELRTAAELSGGVLGQALALLGNESFGELSELARQGGEALLRGDEYGLLAVFAQVGQSRERLPVFFQRMTALVRGALRVQLGVQTPGDSLLQRMAASLTPGQLEALAALAEEGLRALEGNANPGLLGNYLTARMAAATTKGDNGWQK